MKSRPYENLSDFEKMVALVIHIKRDAHYLPHFHLGDLSWQIYRYSWFNPHQNIYLWEDDDNRLIAFTLYQRRNRFEFEIDPMSQNAEMMRQMLVWAEQRQKIAIQQGEEGADQPLQTVTFEDDVVNIAAIEAHGLTFRGPLLFYNSRSLNDPIAEMALPNGFELHHTLSEQDIPKRVEVHQKAFNSLRVTVESYRKLMSAPGYKPDLDVFVIAPDGRFASYCNGWIDEVNKVGNIEPMGTHPDFQNMGLGKAVLAEVMRNFKRYGATSAIVCSETDNIASKRLYTSVGFHIASTLNLYSME